jgi:polyphenol oxidase
MFLPLLTAPGFRAVLSTRVGGVSPEPWDSQNHGTSTGDTSERVARNGERLMEAVGLAPREWARLSQAHGRGIVRVDRPGHLGEADGLWTDATGLPIAIRVADCAAVVISHPGTGRIGVAHAGWRGAVAGVVEALLTDMAVPPGEVWAGISAHLRPCCFEVGEDVVGAFQGRFVEPRPGGRWSLRLGEALRQQLLGLGVPEARVEPSPLCTSCDRALLFSHRRDRGRTGRMVALAWRS